MTTKVQNFKPQNFVDFENNNFVCSNDQRTVKYTNFCSQNGSVWYQLKQDSIHSTRVIDPSYNDCKMFYKMKS